MKRLIPVALLILILSFMQPAYSASGDGLSAALARTEQLAIPIKDQCISANATVILEDFEDGIGNVGYTGATPILNKDKPLYGDYSLTFKLTGSSQATVRIECPGKVVRDYTGILAWVRPSRDDIRMGVNLLTDKGTVTIRPQGLRHAGESLPAYMDFAGSGMMSQDIGRVNAIILIFYPASGGEVDIDNIGLADATYGSFNRAWWDESGSRRFVDQRFQETLNDYLTLYTLKGGKPEYRDAIIKGVDNLLLSKQPDGWTESGTTALITAGTLGATLANCYIALKDDPAMDERIDVYGDNSHSRKWWIEKCLGQNVKFIDYVFTIDVNGRVVRNQMMEGARATYLAYLATGEGRYMDSYRSQMSIIEEGRQGCGIYPEWTGTYDPSIVMYDSSYTGVQLSALLTLAAMGEKDIALPMTVDLFKTIEGVIDPSTGMLMNLNSTRRSDKTGDLRWQDGLLYRIGVENNVPGMVRFGYILNQVSPTKNFPADFHSALPRYYDLKYYLAPAADNGYRLPQESPAYSIRFVDMDGEAAGSVPVSIMSGGYYQNPTVSRQQNTFPLVCPFYGTIEAPSGTKAWFNDNAVTLEGNGHVTIRYSGVDLARLSLPASGEVTVQEVNGAGQTIKQAGTTYEGGKLAYSTEISGKTTLKLISTVTPTQAASPVPSITTTPSPSAPADGKVQSVCVIPFAVMAGSIYLFVSLIRKK